MAGFGDLLQRIARSLEEASAQRPGDDLRARLGYGTGEDGEEDLALDEAWEPETDRTAEPESTWRPEIEGEAESTWTPAASRGPVRGTTAPRMPETPRAAHAGTVPGSGSPFPPASPPSSRRASTVSPLPNRIRARLHAPDVLRESIVVKEILDRPLGRRRGR